MTKTKRFSDSETRISELKEFVGQFCDRRDWSQFHSPKDLAIGVVTEAAELIENFRFQNEAQSLHLLDDSARRERICDELADVFFFLLRFSQMYGIDLASEMGRKMRKNALRYPVETSRGNNKKYSEE